MQLSREALFHVAVKSSIALDTSLWFFPLLALGACCRAACVRS
jgi:hypothetical protein